MMPRMQNRIVALVFLACLAACASIEPSVLVQRKFVPLSPQKQRVKLPTLNEENEAEVGDSIVSSGELFTRPAIRFLQGIVHTGRSKGPYSIDLPAGEYLGSGRSTFPVAGTFFEYPTPLRFHSQGSAFAVKGGWFLPDLEGGTPQIYWHATDTGVPLTDPHPGVRFERTQDEEFRRDSYRQELIYNGKAGSTIKFIYREFVSNMIRPAFTQDVTYDLADGDVIGFKGARFIVHSADNTTIHYTVTSHLEQ